MTTTIATSFAKLFELPGDRQLAAYVDPSDHSPALAFVCEASGVTATSTMGLNSKENDASLEEQRAGLAALLDLIDEKKAKELFGILENTLNDHIPHLKILDELSQMAGQVRKPFARVVEGPSGDSVLLIRGNDGDTPYLQAVTREENFKTQFPIAYERDKIFLHNEHLSRALPSSMLEHLGIPEGASTAPARKPGM